jgi:hypothetical protein
MEQIKKEFSKHYKRLEDDLSQINGFTPVMKKVMSINFKNLEVDILCKIEKLGLNNEEKNFNK